MSAPQNTPTEWASMHAVIIMSLWFLLMKIHRLATSCYGSLAGLKLIMADRPSTPLASISTPPHPLHETVGNFSPPQHIRTDDSVANNLDTIWQHRDKYFRVYFTFVQGQTPVTPPTLANTKENWMEVGTDHVICLGKKWKYVQLEAHNWSF